NRKSSDPPPPYSSGMLNPMRPYLPAATYAERSTIRSRSHFSAFGATSRSMYCRVVSRSCSCSGSKTSRFICDSLPVQAADLLADPSRDPRDDLRRTPSQVFIGRRQHDGTGLFRRQQHLGGPTGGGLIALAGCLHLDGHRLAWRRAFFGHHTGALVDVAVVVETPQLQLHLGQPSVVAGPVGQQMADPGRPHLPVVVGR